MDIQVCKQCAGWVLRDGGGDGNWGLGLVVVVAVGCGSVVGVGESCGG